MSKQWHKKALELHHTTDLSWRKIARELGVPKSTVSDYLRKATKEGYLDDVSSKPKVLLFDIETSKILAYVWGLFKQNISINSIKEDWYVICWSAQWLGEDEIINSSVHDLNNLEEVGRYRHNEQYVVEALWSLLDEADVVVAYNGKSFDKKKMNWKFFEYGLPEPSPYKIVDPYLIVKGNFKPTSGKMDYIVRYVDSIENGKHTTNETLWHDCMNDDEEALDYMQEYCITPDHKLLKDDLRWYEARNLKEGDKVLGFDEYSSIKKRRLFRESTIQKITYDVQPVYEVKLSSGKIFKTTKEHKWLVKSKTKGGIYVWATTEDLQNCPDNYTVKKVLDTWEEDYTKDAGWLAGMFDGEGCLSFRGTKLRNGLKPITNLTIAQRPTKVLERLEKLIPKFADVYGSRITKEGSDCITLDIQGFKYQKLKFLGKLRPERLVNKVKFDQLGSFEGRAGDEKILSVTPVGEQEIIKISTDTGTFICDGYAHHNCDQDIHVLREVYKATRGWDKNSPNMALYYDDNKPRCNSCGSTELTPLPNASATTNVSKFSVVRCEGCNKILRDRENVLSKEKRKSLHMNVR